MPLFHTTFPSLTLIRREISPENISHHRKLNCLYCLCVMFFAHNCCSVPLHLLLTDLIDSQGGSSELIRILNRFGAVASNHTHRRYVQFKVQQKMKSGYLNDLNLNNFTVATVDNIYFLQKYSFVFHGDQSCSNMECSMTAEQDQQLVDHSPNPSAIGKKRTTRPASKPSPTLTSKSPANKKVTRRSRSLVECKTPRK